MHPRQGSALLLVLALAVAADAWAQERIITGRVVAAAGGAVPGASVTVLGTPLGALTDGDGGFAIRGAPAGEVTLLVQTVGYRSERATVAPGQSSVTIELDVDVLALDELVVTGRVTSISRRNLAHAIATVDAREMERTPASTVERALQGKIAGATIESNSGAPGGGMQVRMRGVSTINGLSEPLWVIDGMIVSNAAIPSNANAVTRAAGGSNPSLMQDAVVNRITDINPEDIETIEVLKGAAAAAMYGSKAANGVIVVTTKRGRPGAPRFQVTQRVGVYDLSKKLGMRTFETEQEAIDHYGAEAAKYFEEGVTYDQEELLAGRNDLSLETTFSVSGGSDDGSTRYFASGLWKNDEGIMENTGFDKQSVRLNLDQRLGGRVTMGLSTSVIHTLAQRGLSNNDNSGTSPYVALTRIPSFVDVRRCTAESGNPDCTPDAYGSFPASPFAPSNPLQTLALMRNDEDVWRYMALGNLEVEALRRGAHDLRLLATGGVDYFAQENELYFPPELQFEPEDDGLPGTSLLSKSDNINLNLSVNAVYTYAPAGGALRATSSIGVQYEEEDLNIARITSRNLIAGQPNVDAGTVVSVDELRREVRDAGFYAQEELLMLDERLLLSAGIRGDRSSANGNVDRYFFYPKAAASYRFLGPIDLVDELKLRVAWGQSGNRPLFGQKFTPLRASDNAGGLPGLVVGGVTGDPDLEPEQQTEIEGGLDAELFGGRASLQLTGYQKTVKNLLLQRTLAPSTGFQATFFNGGEMRTRGVEIALAATPILMDRVSWISRITFSANRSLVTDLPVPSFRAGGFGTVYGSYEIAEGRSPTMLMANVGLSPDGELIVGEVGDANPDFRMSFSNDLTFGDFTLYGLVDWQQGGHLANLTKLLFDDAGNSPDYDRNPRTVSYGGQTFENVGDGLDRLLRLAYGGDSRAYIEDASYVKVREISLAYDVPASVTSSLLGGAVESLRLTLSGRNLLTFTDYTGLDPEVSNFGNQPIARNIDVAPFPPSRSFWFSASVSF